AADRAGRSRPRPEVPVVRGPLGSGFPDFGLDLTAIARGETEFFPEGLEQFPLVLGDGPVLEGFLGDRAVDAGPILEHLLDDLGLDPVLFLPRDARLLPQLFDGASLRGA